VIRGQKVIFRLGAPVPQMGTLSSGSVGGFCSAHRGPTFCESRLEIFYTVSEIFRVKLFPFSPHIVTTDDNSESPLRHMVEGLGGYNVLEFRGSILYAARVGGRRMFRGIPQYGNRKIYETETCLCKVRCSIENVQIHCSHQFFRRLGEPRTYNQMR